LRVFALAPGAPGATSEYVGATQCANGAGFVPAPAPVSRAGAVAVPGAVSLLPSDVFGGGEPVISPVGTDRILVQIPGLDPAKIIEARQQLSRVAKLEFRLVYPDNGERLRAIDAGTEVIPPEYRIETYKIQQDEGKKSIDERLLVKKKADLGGDRLGGPGHRAIAPVQDPVEVEQERVVAVGDHVRAGASGTAYPVPVPRHGVTVATRRALLYRLDATGRSLRRSAVRPCRRGADRAADRAAVRRYQ
jgi:hypothetical protein